MRWVRSSPGFSLIELVIVVVIIGIIAAIAIPRMTRGAASSGEKALVVDLRSIRGAIDQYCAEHDGRVPTNALTLANQLTMYTDAAGNVSAVQTLTHVFGPYLCAVPPLPVGRNRGSSEIRSLGVPGTGTQGWFYYPSGEIRANTGPAEVDLSGRRYNQY